MPEQKKVVMLVSDGQECTNIVTEQVENVSEWLQIVLDELKAQETEEFDGICVFSIQFTRMTQAEIDKLPQMRC